MLGKTSLKVISQKMWPKWASYGQCHLAIFHLLLDGDGLLAVQRMGTSPFHSPTVSVHKKLSAVV